MNNQLTILIPTSPIPSHPSTAILDETISNIRKYTDAEIKIMFDGVHESHSKKKDAYNQYLLEVLGKASNYYYGACSFICFDEHTHQAEMTRKALEDVTTPLIMFVEHDTWIGGEIPFQQLCDLVQSEPDINYLRFSIFDQVPQSHWYLMIDKQPKLHKGVPLIQTQQFSARPHIAKSDWYRKALSDHFQPGEKTMIEDRMHSVVQVSYNNLLKEIFGLYIYAPPGNMLRSFHSDGRGNDEKIIEA